MLPSPTARLRFRRMSAADLDLMAALLGDPEVMAHYPAPKTRAEALRWIEWNERNYAAHGYGLWIIETHDGVFLGDCGLTWQRANSRDVLEIGYHVRAAEQGKGFATEAALACRDLARRERLAPVLTAIIDHENIASQRVAEKLGMTIASASIPESPSNALYSMSLGAGE